MSKSSHHLLALSLALPVFYTPAAAQNTTSNSTQICEPNESTLFSYVNATTNLTVQAFAPSSLGQHSWNINVGIHDIRNSTTNSSSDQLAVWINSSDPNKDLYDEDLPFEGCQIRPVMQQYKNSSGTGENSCDGVFSLKCYEAILSYATNSAAKPWDVNETRNCLNLISLPDDCKNDGDTWGAAGTTGVIFGNGTDTCSKPRVTEGSAFKVGFPMTDWQDNLRGGYDNFTTYERFASKATPMLFVAWSKNQTDRDWSDARLICPIPIRSLREAEP